MIGWRRRVVKTGKMDGSGGERKKHKEGCVERNNERQERVTQEDREKENNNEKEQSNKEKSLRNGKRVADRGVRERELRREIDT